MRHIKLGPLKKFLMTVLIFLLNVTYHTNLSAAGYTCSNTQATWFFAANSGASYKRLVDVWCSSHTYFCFRDSRDMTAAQSCEAQSCTGTGQSGNKVWDPSNGQCIDYGCTCKPGYYVNGNTCSACSAGYACPGGLYLAYSNGGSTICSAGHYAAAARSACISCSPGYYADGSGNSSCTACPSGSYQSRYGSHGCYQCLPGTYASKIGTSSCSPCAVGRYASSYGATACASCSPGYYQSSTGQSSCTACLAGRYAANSGMSTCNLCSSGYWVAGTANSGCNSCIQPANVTFNGNTAVNVSGLSLYGPAGATTPTQCYIVAKTYSLSDGTGNYVNSTNCSYKE